VLRTTAAALVILLAMVANAALAAVADTARETRWAEQIVPQLVVGDAVWLTTPRHPRVLAIFTEPSVTSSSAVIVVHGLGVNPDWNLIGVIRTSLADLGFATLSVQMPVLAVDAPRDDYESLFPDAGERLSSAVTWLVARGYSRIAVMSHSMGAAMVNAWLAATTPSSVRAWVPVGMFVPFAAAPRLPVQDVVAERDFPEAIAQAKVRAGQLMQDGCSAPLVVDGTDHYFDGAAGRLAAAVAPFIKRALDEQCR
jgi:pimeloyl-ACP methyl ester carboxylesterase